MLVSVYSTYHSQFQHKNTPPTSKMSTTEIHMFENHMTLGFPFPGPFLFKCSPFSRPLAQKQPPSQDHSQQMPPMMKNGIQHYHKLPKHQQEMLLLLQQCPPYNIKQEIKMQECHHHKNYRQHPLTTGSCRHPSQSTHTQTDASRSLSELSRYLHLGAITTSTTPHQVSHFTTLNPLSSVETCLIIDITTDRQTSFHTTLQIINSQGSNLSM